MDRLFKHYGSCGTYYTLEDTDYDMCRLIAKDLNETEERKLIDDYFNGTINEREFTCKHRNEIHDSFIDVYRVTTFDRYSFKGITKTIERDV